LLSLEEIRCTVNFKIGDVKYAISEEMAGAIARLKNQLKKIVFEVTT